MFACCDLGWSDRTLTLSYELVLIDYFLGRAIWELWVYIDWVSVLFTIVSYTGCPTKMCILCLIPRTTVTSLSASKDKRIICASIPGFRLNASENTEVTRATTSELCYTRWRHGRSRGETKYRQYHGWGCSPGLQWVLPNKLFKKNCYDLCNIR